MNRSALALCAAAATGVQVGAAIVATRYVAADISPTSLAFLRYAIGVACLLPALAMVRVRFARADILPIALLGIGQFGILIALLNYGLKTVPAARGALIFATFPFLTLLFAALFKHELITFRKFAGIFATVFGVFLALSEKILDSASAHAGWSELGGELAILASAATGAICSVLYRPYLARYPTLPVSAFAMAAAAAALLVPAALGDLFVAPAQLTAGAWAAIVFIGLSSGSFYVVWLWALKTIAATRVTVFLALSPITAAVLGVTLLGEPVTAGMIAGVACVAAGLWVAGGEDKRSGTDAACTPPSL